MGEYAGVNNTGNNVNAFGSNASAIANTYNNVNLFGESATATANGQTVLSKDGTIMARINTTDLTDSREYDLPDEDGVLATREWTQNAVITVELIDSLEVDFYATDDLKINSTSVIVGSGTITIEVNDSAYTLETLIDQGDKITVSTTTASVVNLIGKYE
jgi:hypothetical protein